MIPGFTIWFLARAPTTLLPHVLGRLIDVKFFQKCLFSNRLCLAVFAFKKFCLTFLQWGFAHYSLLLNISLFTWGLSFFFVSWSVCLVLQAFWKSHYQTILENSFLLFYFEQVLLCSMTSISFWMKFGHVSFTLSKFS